jgi:DNA-binding MarR family transcriptional regulator
MIRIHLTKKGLELRPTLSEERDQANQELLAEMTLEEKVLLKRLLKDLQT